MLSPFLAALFLFCAIRWSLALSCYDCVYMEHPTYTVSPDCIDDFQQNSDYKRHCTNVDPVCSIKRILNDDGSHYSITRMCINRNKCTTGCVTDFDNREVCNSCCDEEDYCNGGIVGKATTEKPRTSTETESNCSGHDCTSDASGLTITNYLIVAVLVFRVVTCYNDGGMRKLNCLRRKMGNI
ncbi:uncharacterized protein LOC100374778 [Saccoglossus kowalevskii]|uniref:Uncharacterized protein LOC100374778 n=1 Tax=Saccoglossus kowalevskii TaxID=10224 RepID=A0ABM0GS16_SACKO|nr:PREDICTED: uncharacterized protein LOC100374778 [Saccoglossus kowalevskii]